MTLHDVHQFNELHAKTDIRLVATVILHSICPWHTDKRLSQFYPTKLLEEVLCHPFKQADYIFLFYETHFAVYLCKFRLTVRTQVLVAETLYNLEVTVHALYHQ